MKKGYYYTNYDSFIIVSCEHITFVHNSDTESLSYLHNYKIIEKYKNRYILLDISHNSYTHGKFSQLDFIEETIKINNCCYKYIACYFTIHNENDLFNINKPAEKDLSKYTFSISHCINSNNSKKYLKTILNEISKLY